MAAHQQHFYPDFWIGMITAGPVMMVAYGTVFRAVQEWVYRWSGRARSVWAVVPRLVVGAFVFLSGGLFAPGALTVDAAFSLAGRGNAFPPVAAAYFLTVAVVAFVVMVSVLAGRPSLRSHAADTDRATGPGDP